MWQEARKQEKKLRGIMIDYKKRAERRQAYYTKMKMDPNQLIRIYGQKCKYHIMADANVDGQLMPWQGDPTVMIDRFDVRAHLDIIPEGKKNESGNIDADEEKLSRKCNYERYRTLVQIDATGAEEEQYLKQLEIEEEYGKRQAEREKERKSLAKAKIHYRYEDSSNIDQDDDDFNADSDEDSDSDLSDIDINVNILELNNEQQNHLDALATQYGIGYGQYCRQLLLEKKEFEYVKRLEEEEEERSKMPGRKGKSARRSLRAKQKTLRGSPLSFALKESPIEEDKTEESSDSSRSNSPAPPNEGKIEFITEFGGETELNTKVEDSDKKAISNKSSRNNSKEESRSSRKHSRRSRSRSRSKHRRSRSKDHHRKNRSDSRDRNRSNRRRSRSKSSDRRSRQSKSSRHSRSRSRSASRSNHSYRSSRNSRSRSPVKKSSSHSRSKSRDRHDSKENSAEKSKEVIAQRLGSEKTTAAIATIDKSKLTPREKMKLRMQKMLNKQIKIDKKEEQKKQNAKDQEVEEREQEIYELSRMMRNNRDREKKFRRSISPKGRIPSYDASNMRYKPRSRSRSPV